MSRQNKKRLLLIPDSSQFVLKSAYVLNRDAAEEEEDPGHIGGLRAWRGEPGWLEAQRRQPHPGAPMGAGENGAAA